MWLLDTCAELIRVEAHDILAMAVSNSPDVAVSGIVEHYVSSIVFKVQFVLQPLGKLAAIYLVLIRVKIPQASLISACDEYRGHPSRIETTHDCQFESRLMITSESDGVIVIVTNSDVGLGFTQDLCAELKSQPSIMTRLQGKYRPNTDLRKPEGECFWILNLL